MNVSVYIFGKFNNGYSQYPDDYASAIFQKFTEKAKSTTQIAIHRDGNLVYYGYIRKLQKEKYIGFCIVLNGLLLNRIDGLFSLFENTISNLAANGRFIHFDEQGEIVTSVEKLYLNKEEIDLLTESLRAGFNRMEPYAKQLPAVNYGTIKDACKDFVIDDNLDDIIKSSHTNGYTFIYKSKGFNTSQMNSYSNILNNAYKEKKELQDKLSKLETEHAKTLRQKKQFKFVLILIFVLLGCGIGLLSLNDNLNIARLALSSANDTINMQNDSLNSKSREISDLNDEKDELEAQRKAEKDKRVKAEESLAKSQKAEEDLAKIHKIIGERQPFIVKNTSFNFSTGYLTIEYYGIVEGTTSIKIQAYDVGGGETFSNSASINVSKGEHTTKVFLNGNLDDDYWYSFEIQKGDVIIGGGKH